MSRVHAIAPPGADIGASALLQRKCACAGACRAGESDAAALAQPAVREVLRSPGNPLDRGTRGFFESRLAADTTPGPGPAARDAAAAERQAERAADAVSRPAVSPRDGGHDFARVRVHADAAAAASARAVHALAYTVGNHIVFGAGQFSPTTAAGRRLLAHELTHTLQQRGEGGARLARQCDPTWAGLAWSQRVANVRAMSSGAARDQCMADMIDEALTPNVTVEQRTNSSPTLDHAIAHGRYAEWGSLSDLHVNFDRNLAVKTGNTSQFGETRFRTTQGGASIEIYIVLGPSALDPVGPQHTQMAFHHESEHAWKFLSQFAMIGSTPHGATAGEELEIHTEGFSRYFLDLWTINNTAGTFRMSNTFQPIFTYAASATQAERDASFDSIRLFHQVRIQGIPCNEMKFKIWLQMMQNAQPASDAMVARINALPGLALTRGTSPATHLNTALACS